MILVADCSALVALSICNRLELLEQIFGQVVVPEAVYDEATQPNKKQASQLKIYLKDKVRKVDMQNYVFLDGFADAGETEAMVLYKQISADKLLIDDQRGRNVAKINHIETIGSLGVLLVAKQRGLIEEVAPLLHQLDKSDIYLSKQLIATVLELANETNWTDTNA
jgi:predicted nucleic acid-binding protein